MITNVTAAKMLDRTYHQIAHAQMDNGNICQFVPIVTTLVQLVKTVQLIVKPVMKTELNHPLVIVPKVLMILVNLLAHHVMMFV